MAWGLAEFDAEQQMKSLEEEVLSLYGENLAKLAEEHLSAADAARKHAESEKELHEAQEANKSPISSEAKVEEIKEMDAAAQKAYTLPRLGHLPSSSEQWKARQTEQWNA